MIASAQANGVGDGWSVTRKANRRPVYAEIRTFGSTTPEYILVGYESDATEPDAPRLTKPSS